MKDDKFLINLFNKVLGLGKAQVGLQEVWDIFVLNTFRH